MSRDAPSTRKGLVQGESPTQERLVQGE